MQDNSTYFICPSKDVRRRQFRPVAESGITYCFQSCIHLSIYVCIQITNFTPVDNVRMITCEDMIRRITITCKTKRYGTTLWLVHNLISNIVPKKMGVPLVWRLKLAHYVPKIGKSNKKRCLATIWPLRWCQAKYAIFLLPLFIVPPIYTIIHAYTIYENDTV